MPVLPEPDAAAPVGTVADLVADVYTHLEATSFGVLNRLTADIDELATTLTVDFSNQKVIRPGAYLCIDVEVFYVWDFNEATQTATVQRAMLGSTAAEHVAGALIQIEPRVSQFDVAKELRNDIRSWPPALFRVPRLPLSVSGTTRGYDLNAPTLTRVLEVRGTAANDIAKTLGGWRVDFNADTAVYPSGKAIIFDPVFSAMTVEVLYASPFTTYPWDLTVSLAAVGLTETLIDIPVIGAAARLVREAPRTDTRTQGQSRLAEEVPPGHIMNTSRFLMKMRDDRVHQEIARLRERFPQRRG